MARQDAPGVALVGPLDAPVGGVSSHLRRLVDHLGRHGVTCRVIDPYPAKGKRAGKQHELTPFPAGPLSMLWAAWRAWRSPCAAVHLHFSRLTGWFVVLALLLAPSHKRLIGTLHHGDQRAVFDRAGALAALFARTALQRLDVVVALSDEQHAFYRELGVAEGRLVRWRTAPGQAVAPDSACLPAEIRDVLAVAAADGGRVLVSSGYPKRSYRYELVIALLEQALQQTPCHLILCIYGDGADAGYLGELQEKAMGLPVTITGSMPPAGFAALLERTDLYLRPSLIDSFGLAVSDALDAGAAALASDVCQRDSRAEVFAVADVDAFLAKGLRLLATPRPGRTEAPRDVGDPDEIIDTYIEAS